MNKYFAKAKKNRNKLTALINRARREDNIQPGVEERMASSTSSKPEDDYITLNLLPRQPKKGLTTNMRRQIITAPRRASRSAQSAVNAIRGLDRQQIAAALDMADKRVGQTVARAVRNIERFRNAGGLRGMIDRELVNSSPRYSFAAYQNMSSNPMNRRYVRMFHPRVTRIMDRKKGPLSDGVKSQYARAVRNTGTAYATIAAQPLLALLNRAFTPSQKEEYTSGGSGGMRKRGTIHKGKNARRWKTYLAGKENGGGGRAAIEYGIGGLPATKENFYTGGYVHNALNSRYHPAHNTVVSQLDAQRKANAISPEYINAMRNARNANPSSRSSNPVRNLNAKLDELANQLAPINRAKKKQNQMKELRSYQQRQKTLHNTVLAATALKALQEAAKNRFQ